MVGTLTGISSMATRAVLAELADAYAASTGVRVDITSVGGVDAARRITAGETFDTVILASDALDKLIAAGHVQPGRVDLVRSPVALAVRSGSPHPDVSTEAALKQAVLAAPALGYSTGPSGNHLAALFARWGIADQVRERIVVPLDVAAGGTQEYVEDCPVCCSPNVLAVRVDDDGTVEVNAQAE